MGSGHDHQACGQGAAHGRIGSSFQATMMSPWWMPAAVPGPCGSTLMTMRSLFACLRLTVAGENLRGTAHGLAKRVVESGAVGTPTVGLAVDAEAPVGNPGESILAPHHEANQCRVAAHRLRD